MNTVNRPITRLNGSQHGKHNGDQRRTKCKLCPDSVLIGEPAVWLTSPIGLSHEGCARRAGLLEAA